MSVGTGFAQDATSGEAASADEEVIVVRGIRSSLKNAQAIKRDADTFVDAITSEDIGALPDRSVTEALQRVPGITISRFAAANDPDHFSIEGQGVIVRGLTYVRSEVNGRDTFSANNGRALSFADVSPELLGSVEVYKNQTADLIEGGVAGSVNLVTRKPFDARGRVIAGTLEYNYSDFREDGAPTGSILWSDRFDTSLGEMGFLLSAVSSDLKTRSDGSQASSFQPRYFDPTAGRLLNPSEIPADDPATTGVNERTAFLSSKKSVYALTGAALRSQDYDRGRVGFSGAFQWQNPDKTWVATAEFLRTEATTSWNEHVVEIATDVATDGRSPFFIPGTAYGFDGDGLFTNGTISVATGWKADQPFQTIAPGVNASPRTPVYGLQSNNIKRDVEQTYLTEDMAINFKWTPNDHWSFNFDAQKVDSTVSNVDFTLWGSTFQDVTVDLRPDIPNVILAPPTQTVPGSSPVVGLPSIYGGGNPSNFDPAACGGAPNGACPAYFRGANNSFSNPFNSFWRAAMDHLEDSEGEEQAFRGDAEYRFDDDKFLKTVRMGVRYSERTQTTRFSTYNWGALSEIWGNNGPVWFDNPALQTGVVAPYNWNGFMRGEAAQPPAYLYYTPNIAKNYNEAAAFADSVVKAWRTQGNGGVAPTTAAGGGGGGWRRLAERDGVVAGTPYLPGEINNTVEETNAAYLKVSFGTDDLFGTGLTLDGNIGVRYVETTFSSDGGYNFPLLSSIPNDTGLPAPDGNSQPNGANRCLTPTNLPMGSVYLPPGFCSLSSTERANIKAFSNGASVSTTAVNKYENVLPSVNFKLGLNDEMLIRAAYSRGMSRPDLGLQRNYFTITPLGGADDPRTAGVDQAPTGYGDGWYGFTASGGNPFLKPVVADNYDISFEWYFDEAGSLTVSAFYKEIEGIVSEGQGDLTFSNNGATVNNVFTRQPTNSKETGKVQGVEIAYQQFYDFLPGLLSGLGTQFSITALESDGVSSGTVDATGADPTGGAGNNPLVDLDELPLQGLSDLTINAALIYEKGPISARAAYNWRSDYLVTPRDVITPFYPIFQNDSGQLDASFFYTLSDNIKVGVQGANLLNEVTETESYLPNSGGLRGARSFFMNDRRVTASIRYKF